MDLKQHIRGVPDFPKPGILFYDISTLLAHAEAWQRDGATGSPTALAPHRPDLLVGIESRGFLVAAPLALSLDCGFVMVRKKGKLPGATIPHTYDLEYGSDTIEIQADAIAPGSASPCSTICSPPAARMSAAIALCRNGRRQRGRRRLHHRVDASSTAATGSTCRSARCSPTSPDARAIRREASVTTTATTTSEDGGERVDLRADAEPDAREDHHRQGASRPDRR